jgi:hypothetical protein
MYLIINNEQVSASSENPIKPINSLFTRANWNLFIGFMGFYVHG